MRMLYRLSFAHRRRVTIRSEWLGCGSPDGWVWHNNISWARYCMAHATMSSRGSSTEAWLPAPFSRCGSGRPSRIRTTVYCSTAWDEGDSRMAAWHLFSLPLASVVASGVE